jgi:hypothetical protein
MQSVSYFFPDLIKIGIFLQILVKVLNMKLYEKSRLVGVPFCEQGRTKGHDQPNSHACKSLVKKGRLRVQTGQILLAQDRC